MVFEVLNTHGSHLKRTRHGKTIRPASETRELSPATIVKMARTRMMIQHTTSSRIDELNLTSSSGLPFESTKDISLTQSLLSAAEMFSKRDFDCAEKFLKKCTDVSSLSGNPVERTIRFFARALQGRIDNEKGKIDLGRTRFNLEDNLLKYRHAIIMTGQKIPSPQIVQFTAAQAILDSVGVAQRIHVLDFGINNGLHGSIMIQTLANRENCPVELLKLSIIGPSRNMLEEAGKRLTAFARSINFPFQFKPIVSETKLEKDLFDLEPEEVLVVYLGLHLWSLLAWPNQLTTVLQFIKNLNPCVIILNEFEASTNTSTFVHRFQEAFTFFLTAFDCLDTCLKGDATSKKIMEEVFFWDTIHNMITTEDEERVHRQERIVFWRRLLAELGIVGVKLSDSSLYQANLLIEGNEIWKKSCTLRTDGECLIVEWKDTPMQSISAWKIDDGRN